MHLSALQRIGILLLAMLPVAWGNCPGWFRADAHPGETRGEMRGDGARDPSVTRAACPCCAKRSRESLPVRGCDDCPIVAVRRTASPVPPTVVLPPPLLSGLLLAPRLDVPHALHVITASRIEPIRPGRPPDLVGTVVLIV